MKDTVCWDPQTLQNQLQENPDIRMIDVRSQVEYESVHIAGSYNIPMDSLTEHGPQICENLRDPVVFVCLSGMRATKAQEATCSNEQVQSLIQEGLTHIHVLEGGLRAWQAAGGKVNRGRNIWSVERQIRMITGSIVLISVILSVFVPWTKWIAAFIGGGLTFAALSGICGMEMMITRMPWNQSKQADIDKVVDKLITDMKPTS